MSRVGVIGEGKMGTNLFHYIAGFPFDMCWVVSHNADLEKIRKGWSKKVLRGLNTGIIDTEQAARMEKAIISDDIHILSGCDLVIEAITEDPELKQNLFRLIDPVIPPSAILSTNSSSILPSALIPSERRSERTIGLHFFYPVGIKNIVEMIVTGTTSKATVDAAQEFLAGIGRKWLLQDEPNAFVLNRIFLEFQAEAFAIVSEGILTPAQVDDLVRTRLFPLGPFECVDAVGTDVMVPAIRNYILTYPDRHRYNALLTALKAMQLEGRLGVKSGRGFFNYRPDAPAEADLPLPISENVAGIVESRLMKAYDGAIARFSVNAPYGRDELLTAMDEYLGR